MFVGGAIRRGGCPYNRKRIQCGAMKGRGLHATFGCCLEGVANEDHRLPFLQK
jgi:hypothetical protein